MAWQWKNRKRFNTVMAVKEPFCSSSNSLSSAEMNVDEKMHKKTFPPAVHNRATGSQLRRSGSQRAPPSVHFDHVEIRTYKTILGDNPFTDIPLALDWDYDEPQRWSVDEFEDAKHFKPDTYKSANDYEPLTTLERHARLLKMGQTKESIRNEERRRKVGLIMDWAYRQNRDELTPSPCYNGCIYFNRYVV